MGKQPTAGILRYGDKDTHTQNSKVKLGPDVWFYS